MDQKQFDAMMDNWLKRQADLPGNEWGKMDLAKEANITDGSRPQAFATREEVATMIMAAIQCWNNMVIEFLENYPGTK